MTTDRIPVFMTDPTGGSPGQSPIISPDGSVVQWADIGGSGAGSSSAGSGVTTSGPAVLSSGDISLVAVASFSTIHASLERTVDASAGDVLLIVPACAVSAGSSGETHFDAATIVGGSAVNFASGNTSGLSGVSAWIVSATNTLERVGGAVEYVVQPGDVVAGQVTVRLMYQHGNATTPKTFYASGIRTAKFSVINLTKAVTTTFDGGSL